MRARVRAGARVRVRVRVRGRAGARVRVRVADRVPSRSLRMVAISCTPYGWKLTRRMPSLECTRGSNCADTARTVVRVAGAGCTRPVQPEP